LKESNRSITLPPANAKVGMHASLDEQIYRLSKSKLRAADGMSYAEFKRGLRPRYAIVWRDIALGYLGLILVALVVGAVQSMTPWAWMISVPFGALLFGFTLAYLNLFFHEAAHTNLASSAGLNDKLANWLIGIFFGQSIEGYRVVHFGHHQHHGTPDDTEHSYFDPLNMRFVLGALFGVRAFAVARKREKLASSADRLPHGTSRNALLRGMALNGVIVCGCFFAGYWTVSVAWALGVLSLFPFFNALRQLLEHRDELAANDADYTRQAHGRINRIFGDSLLAQTFGAAGFNRHLLHHWEPQLSYTRLRELERFLMTCDCASLFKQRQTTYTKALRHFFLGRQKLLGGLAANSHST
jgi:fatty acid desaturase